MKRWDTGATATAGRGSQGHARAVRHGSFHTAPVFPQSKTLQYGHCSFEIVVSELTRAEGTEGTDAYASEEAGLAGLTKREGRGLEGGSKMERKEGRGC